MRPKKPRVAELGDKLATSFGNYVFADAYLFTQALTHRSAGASHYERMEFLGDSLVNLIVAEALYLRWPKADEGALTRARAELVRESMLAAIARRLDLGAHLILGPGEWKSGGHRRDSILADALEAVVAAIYLDSGFDICRNAVLPWFEQAMVDLPPPHKVEKDPKTRLQEWLQGKQLPLPVYAMVCESGDEHAKLFRVTCSIERPALISEGEGGSRRAAEQVAAEAVLVQLQDHLSSGRMDTASH